MVTAPREDASALERVRSVLDDPWVRLKCAPWCKSDEPMNHGPCDCGSQQLVDDLHALCTLVEQGERDRRRLCEELDDIAHVPSYPLDSRDAFHFAIRRVVKLRAAMQPNDSAARTGQEG